MSDNHQHRECANCLATNVCEACAAKVHAPAIQAVKEGHAAHAPAAHRSLKVIKLEIHLAKANINRVQLSLTAASTRQSNLDIRITRLQLKHENDPKAKVARQIADLEIDFKTTSSLVADITSELEHWARKLVDLGAEKERAKAMEEESAA